MTKREIRLAILAFITLCLAGFLGRTIPYTISAIAWVWLALLLFRNHYHG